MPAPKPEQVLKVGFGSPGQAFRSFGTAVQGELLDTLHNSLSEGFRKRNGLSRLGFREAWERLEKEEPLLRWALYQITKSDENYEVDWRAPQRVARVRGVIRGTALEVTLVEEDFWEVYVLPAEGGGDPYRDPDLESDGYVKDLLQQGVVMRNDQDPTDDRLFVILKDADPRIDLERIAYVKTGREWKVDGYRVDDADSD